MFSYIGGKHGMIKEILAAFPVGYEKMSYIEVFGGFRMGFEQAAAELDISAKCVFSSSTWMAMSEKVRKAR